MSLEKMVYPATLEHLHAILAAVVEKARDVGFPEDQISKIQLVLEEALVNIINYAYPKGKTGQFEVSLEAKKGESLKIILRDQGKAFDPVTKGAQARLKHNPKASLEERELGGLGLLYILQFMDDVRYERKKTTNILSLTKYIR